MNQKIILSNTKRRLNRIAAVMAALAICILLADAIAVYAFVPAHQPAPYIQNRSNWCWATCAKLVSERYNSLYHLQGVLPTGAVVATNLSGLREDYIGYDALGRKTIDAGQQAIVKYIMGSDVNNPGTKTQTFKAMRYATALSAEPERKGDAYDGSVLLEDWKSVDAVLNAKLYVIANVLVTPTFGHSLVIKSYDRRTDRFTVYDVWDGTTVYVTKQKLLVDGFKSAAGTAPVTWVYYITNPDYPPALVSEHPSLGRTVETGNKEAERAALSQFNNNLILSGNCTVNGKAPFNFIVYTSINGGNYYAVRADENGEYSQWLGVHLKAGDVIKMYCESPSGEKTEPTTVTVTQAKGRNDR